MAKGFQVLAVELKPTTAVAAKKLPERTSELQTATCQF
jgi:hypothetical protein